MYLIRGNFFGHFYHKEKIEIFWDIFDQKKNPEKDPELLCSKNGKKYPKNIQKKSKKISKQYPNFFFGIFLIGRS